MNTPFTLVPMALCVCATVYAAEFRGLGDLPGGEEFSTVRAMSSDGNVIVGYSRSRLGTAKNLAEPIVWTPDQGIVGLGIGGIASGISSDGAAVVGENDGVPFRWSSDRQLETLELETIGWKFAYAAAANLDGSVIVGTEGGSRGDAFIWADSSGVTYLPPVDWMDDQQRLSANDVSIDGTIVLGNSQLVTLGGGRLDRGSEGFLWSADEGYQHIAPIGDIVTTEVRAMSDDGTTAVGGLQYMIDGQLSSYSALWWREDVGVVDTSRHIPHTFFYEVSGDGNVAVGQQITFVPGEPEVYHAVVWDEIRGLRRIEDIVRDKGLEEQIDGWKLEQAFAASHDGNVIAGIGTNSEGKREGWRLVLDELPLPMLIPGDANLDSRVTFEDFLSLSQNYEKGAFWYQGDFDRNSRVDLDDFLILLDAFATTSVTVVPEPTNRSVMWCLVLFNFIIRCMFARSRR